MGAFRGLFQNFQSYDYWSNENTPYAWDFRFFYGDQLSVSKGIYLMATAVRPGQVVSPVPEPETYAMLLAGLGLIGFTTWQRKQNFGV